MGNPGKKNLKIENPHPGIGEKQLSNHQKPAGLLLSSPEWVADYVWHFCNKGNEKKK